MLLFIRRFSSCTRQSSDIQIHLMLLFIHPSVQSRCPLTPFKYISCYCLSGVAHITSQQDRNSNTSHVIVYRQVNKLTHAGQRFKYISCYCLSTALNSSFSCASDSNTSHVIVYPGRSRDWNERWEIQIHLMLLFIKNTEYGGIIGEVFKYISCYCLSQRTAA